MSNESFIVDTKDDIKSNTNTSNDKSNTLQVNATNQPTKPNKHPFNWLNMWIIYTPMITIWTIKNEKIIKRNELGYKICLALLAVLVISLSIWYIYTRTDGSGFTLFIIVYLASFTCHWIGKFASMYYFWKYFKLYSSENRRQSGFLLDENQKLIKYINMRMKIILGAAIMCLLTIKSIAFVQMIQSPDTETMDWIYLMRSFITYYVFDIPLYLTQFVLSIDYLEGCLFIKNMNDVIDNTDFNETITEYHTYRNEFKEKIKFLEYYIKCRLLSQILFIWVSISGITEAETSLDAFVDVLYLVLVTLPFFEMVFAGSAATTAFHKFIKKIYSIGTEIDYKQYFEIEDATNNHIQHNLYLYLLQYVTKYPFLVKIFAKEVSIKNFIKICVAFGAAKVATYLFKIHVA